MFGRIFLIYKKLTVNGNGYGLLSADKIGEIKDISISNSVFHITP